MIWSNGFDVACHPGVPVPQNHWILTRVSAFIHDLPGKNGRFIFICNTCSRIDTVQQHTDVVFEPLLGVGMVQKEQDRKSTRLNSSHVAISYAVFCLKKKKKKYQIQVRYRHINV